MGKRNSALMAWLAWPTVLLLFAASFSSASTFGQSRTTRRGGDPKPVLALADLYYKNNDISDKAAVQYRKVRDQFPKSKEAETAQYFLGSYYHRKFYIQREKKLKEDYGLLVEAQGQYEDYTGKYAWRSKSPDWLADAYFNLALVFLQRGDSKKAEEFLGKMYGAAPYDRTTHVYQVVWSPNTKDLIDASFDSKQLAEYANSLIYSYAYGQQQALPQGPPFEIIVEKIKLWCKGRKSLK
ncbi:MAG: tetratricopeptide repeat protein [Pyrinomonadaceae bacterium]|nr:tetratricopeptide repeat protein [Pyrinomonadaceae bacterium]